MGNKKFDLVSNFDIVVPKEPPYVNILDTFKEKHRKEFFYYDNRINDKYLGITSLTLVSGEVFKVSVLRARKHITEEECVCYLNSKKAVFLGAHGLALVYEQALDKLPVSYHTISYGYSMTASIYRDPRGQNQFIISTVDDTDLNKGDILFCFILIK